MTDRYGPALRRRAEVLQRIAARHNHGPFGHDHGHGHGRGGFAGAWGPDAGAFPWRPGRRMRRGDIRSALLAGLLDGPAHGYELISRLEARTGGMWRPSPGSVYPTLQLLQEAGLVTSRDDEGKRVFELTSEGREAAEAAAARVPGNGEWATEEMASIANLRRAVKALGLAARQVTLAGEPGQVEAATRIVTDARQRLYRLLAGDDTAATGEAPPPGD